MLQPSSERCNVCRNACDWRYIGGIYARQKPEVVCATCISDGGLRAHISGTMSLHDIELDDAKPELERELRERTPGVACFNPFRWPVLDGVPLAFIGYGDDKSLPCNPNIQAAVTRAAGEDFPLPTPYALIFKELNGDRYEAAIDFD